MTLAKMEDKFIFHGRHSGPKHPAKLFFLAGVAASTVICAWLALQAPPNFPRALLLVACAAVFALRTGFMTLYLLTRGLGWLEAISDVIVVAAVLYAFLVFWGHETVPLETLDAAALVLFLAGSGLTTFSELSRKRWKDRPENHGHLYTGGAFRYARHINYFGELISFSGFAMLTRSWWAASVPILMLAGFVYVHVPALDKYLRERYAGEFLQQQHATKRLIPFVY